MARVGRLAGAIVAETQGIFYLVGNTKLPCDWPAHGFEVPTAIDAGVAPFLRLSATGAATVAAPYLRLEVEGDALPRLLASVFVIARTGSISERIWRLATGQAEDDPPLMNDVIEARWIAEVPPAIWQIVRDSVLRCS